MRVPITKHICRNKQPEGDYRIVRIPKLDEDKGLQAVLTKSGTIWVLLFCGKLKKTACSKWHWWRKANEKDLEIWETMPKSWAEFETRKFIRLSEQGFIICA